MRLTQHEEHLKAEKRKFQQADIGEIVVHIGQEAIELEPVVDKRCCLIVLLLRRVTTGGCSCGRGLRVKGRMVRDPLGRKQLLLLGLDVIHGVLLAADACPSILRAGRLLDKSWVSVAHPRIALVLLQLPAVPRVRCHRGVVHAVLRVVHGPGAIVQRTVLVRTAIGMWLLMLDVFNLTFGLILRARRILLIVVFVVVFVVVDLSLNVVSGDHLVIVQNFLLLGGILVLLRSVVWVLLGMGGALVHALAFGGGPAAGSIVLTHF